MGLVSWSGQADNVWEGKPLGLGLRQGYPISSALTNAIVQPIACTSTSTCMGLQDWEDLQLVY